MASPKKFCIYHVLFPDTKRKNMMRTLLCGELPEYVSYNVVLPKQGSDDYLKEHIFVKPDNVYYFDNPSGIKGFLLQRIDEIDAIITLDIWEHFWVKDLKKPVFFVQHGIRGSFIANKIIRGYINNIQGDLDQMYTIGKTELHCLCQANIPRDCFTLLPGLPQTDYIKLLQEKMKDTKFRSSYMRKKGFDPNKKYLLMLPSLFHYGLILQPIINIVKEEMKDVEILLKYKTNRYKNLGIADRFENAHQIPHDELIYNYMFADYYLILGYGSAYLEGLSFNNKTILYTEKSDLIQKAHDNKEMYLEPVGNLLIVEGRDRLRQTLRNIDNNSLYDDQYLSSKKELFKREILFDEFEMVTPRILKDIIFRTNLKRILQS